MESLYEIRRAGVTLCRSTVPNLGYSKETLRDMERSGLYLYRNGKREKAAPKLEPSEAAQMKIITTKITNQIDFVNAKEK